MSFLSEGTKKIELSSKFTELCNLLKPNFATSDVFFIATILGYIEGEKISSIDNKGPEFRTSYLNEDQMATLYLILFDEYKSEFTENIQNRDFQRECIEALKKYANSGLEILYNEVFKENIEKDMLLNTHKNYDLDILKFISEKVAIVPF